MSDKCIYCRESSYWSKEDCLPAGLGNFLGKHLLLESICQDCNNAFSKAEEQFLRASPEAFFRNRLNIKGRKYHEKVSPFYRGSSGAPPLIIKFSPPGSDLEMLWEYISGTNEVREIRQIIMKEKDGSTIPIPIPPGINTSDKLLSHLKGYNLATSAEPISFFAAAEEWDNMVQVIKEIWPNKTTSDQIPPKGTTLEIPILIRIGLTSLYFRAVAKIAFHYFLAVFAGTFSGREEEFSPIKSFILEGIGDPKNFVRQSNRQIHYDLSIGMIPDIWGHLLTVEKKSQMILSRLQFFVGPENIPPVFEIAVGENPSRIIFDEFCGHHYYYYPDGPKKGYDGEVAQLRVIGPSLQPY